MKHLVNKAKAVFMAALVGFVSLVPMSTQAATMPDLAFNGNASYQNNTLSFSFGNSGNAPAVFAGNKIVMTIEALGANGALVRSSILVNGVSYGNPYYGTSPMQGLTYTAGQFMSPSYKNFVVPAGTTQIRIKLDPSNVVAESNDGNNSVVIPVLQATNAALSVSLVSGAIGAPIADQVVSAGTALNVLGVKLTATNEPVKLTKFAVKVTGVLNANDVVNLRVYKDNDAAPSFIGQSMACTNNVCTFVWTTNGNLLQQTIQPGVTTVLYVKVDVAPPGQVNLGHSFKFALDTANVEAIGAVSGQLATVSGSAVAAGNTFIAPFAVRVSPDAPAAGTSQNVALQNGTQLGRFKITNMGSAQISLKDIKITDRGSHTGATTKYSLYYASENSNNYLGNVAATGNGSTNFSGLVTPITINGGAYRYVTVVMSDVGNATTGDTFGLSVASLGDVKYNADEVNLGYDGDGDGRLASTITNLYADGTPTLGMIVGQ